MTNVDDLKKGILEEFLKKSDSDKRLKRILKKIEQGAGTYRDVSELASITGRSIGEIVIASLLEQGELPEEVVKKTLQSSFKKNHGIVSEAIRKTQTSMNENAGIGISAIVPKFNTNRSNGLVKLFAEKDKYSNFAKTFAEHAESMSMAAVDDAVRQNAKFHFDSGMRPKITRTTDGKCCEWCSKIAGTYDYEDVKGKGNDIFRRHRCCRCVVEYIPHKGKAINVHAKKETSWGAIERRIELSNMGEGNPKIQAIAYEIARKEGLSPIAPEKAVNIMRKDGKEWEKLLTEDEKLSIKKYSFNGTDKDGLRLFEKINGYTGGRYVPSGDDEPIIAKHAQNIKTSLLKNTINHDIILYRFDTIMRGENWKSGHFLSTSVSPNGALGKKPNTVILVSKSSKLKGAYIEGLAHEGYKKQREFLINQGAQLIKIKEIDGVSYYIAR